MKKIVAVLVLCFIIPLGALALEKPAGVSQDDGNVWDALIVLITELTRHIDQLESENAALRASCGGASIPTTPVFGTASQPTPNATIKVMDMDIKTTFQEPNDVLPHGRYYFTVELTEDGKPSQKQVSVVWPNDHETNSLYAGGSENTTNSNVSGFVSFGPYLPTAKGEKTITFTSEGVSESVKVIVK